MRGGCGVQVCLREADHLSASLNLPSRSISCALPTYRAATSSSVMQVTASWRPDTSEDRSGATAGTDVRHKPCGPPPSVPPSCTSQWRPGRGLLSRRVVLPSEGQKGIFIRNKARVFCHFMPVHFTKGQKKRKYRVFLNKKRPPPLMSAGSFLQEPVLFKAQVWTRLLLRRSTVRKRHQSSSAGFLATFNLFHKHRKIWV